jgi:hypothetical protein
MDEVKNAAALLGKKGGLVKSEKKALAVRENGKAPVKEGSRPRGRPAVNLYMKNIKVIEKKKMFTMIGGEKVENPHITGWHLSYTFDDGRTVENFYQIGFYDKKRALHVFFKSVVEPNRYPE